MYGENRKLGGDFSKAVVEVKYRDEKPFVPTCPQRDDGNEPDR